MRILITGGAGFIGSNLADALLAQGHEVTILDNLSTGRVGNISHHLENDRFHFVNGSILHLPTLERLVRQTDLVFHLAAVAGVKYVLDDPLHAVITNVRGTENVLELAFKYWVRTIIASSSEVYGKSTAVPLREDADRLLGPTSVPRWSYSDAKAIDEYFALGYARKGLPVTIVRYFNAYGPRLDPHGYGSVVARFLSQALQDEPITVYDDGEQTRCFTFVGDTVEGTVRAAMTRAAEGEVLNIGSDRETTINELARLIRELVDSNSEIVHVPSRAVYGDQFEEARRRVPSTRRAKQTLGFEARTSLEEGLEVTLSWFREHVKDVFITTERTS